MNDTAKRRTDPFTFFLVVACLVLAALVVALTMQNRTLKDQMAHMGAGGPAPAQFKAGDTVDPLNLVADDGSTKTIKFGEGETKTILLVFSSHCPACKQTLPVWNEIMKKPPKDGVRIVGIQTDRLDANPSQPALMEAAFPFPVYGYKRPAHDPLEKVPFIPAAIVVDAKGVVQDALFGVPTSDTRAKLEAEL